MIISSSPMGTLFLKSHPSFINLKSYESLVNTAISLIPCIPSGFFTVQSTTNRKPVFLKKLLNKDF